MGLIKNSKEKIEIEANSWFEERAVYPLDAPSPRCHLSNPKSFPLPSAATAYITTQIPWKQISAHNYLGKNHLTKELETQNVVFVKIQTGSEKNPVTQNYLQQHKHAAVAHLRRN